MGMKTTSPSTTTHAPCRLCGHIINRNAAVTTTVCGNCKSWISQMGSEAALVAEIKRIRGL